MPPPANLRRHFLPWDRPLLPQAVAWLAADWAGEGPLDLSDLVVIVPTRQAGRRLREALAGHAAARGAAVFPPRVWQPEQLLAASEAAPGVASRLEALLAWAEVLRTVELEAVRAVFPVDPPARTASWALRLAPDFLLLQRTLAESGLRLADAARRIGRDGPEADRWAQLAQLEAAQAAALAERGKREPQAARLAGAAAAEVAGARRIVMLATPGPLPLALVALAHAAETTPVEVVVLAPPDMTDGFDAWGRPEPEFWRAHELALPRFDERVHVCADPAAQAGQVAAVATAYREPEGRLGVGVADAEVLPPLEQMLTRGGLAAFNPEGRRRAGDALHQLLAALAGLATADAFETVETLARCPAVLEFFGRRLGADFSAERWLKELDALRTQHLPATLAAARRHVSAEQPLAAPLATIAGWREQLRRGEFPDAPAAVLAELFAGRRFDLTQAEDAAEVEAAETWSRIAQEVGAAMKLFPELGGAAGWELALRLYGESRCYEEKITGAVELQGWLELLWEDAPHLIVAGVNDGRVPEAVVGDPFLPESLRERLGLPTNAARLARDAYLLQSLVQSRAQGGRCDLLLGRVSAAGDPLRPSRLLLRCADRELPERVRFLFQPPEEARAMPAWTRAWQLASPVAAPPGKVAVTGFRAWLRCPFRFYLGQVLRLQTVDAEKSEMDVFDFGHVVHAALEAMGSEPALRGCVDAATLREFLWGALEAAVRRQFGTELSLPLLVQVESARQRLARVADVQAQEHADGWTIEAVEQSFEIEIAGLKVRGKIDRLDRHAATGAVRVLDYKTSDKPVEPWQAHLRPVRRDETPPEFAVFDFDGRPHVWTDLQLPLYLRALAVRGETVATCAYFNLPKAAGETGLRPWMDFTRELTVAADRCAEGVAAAIRAGQFWPPNEDIVPESDEFAALFHHGVADSVAEKREGAP